MSVVSLTDPFDDVEGHDHRPVVLIVEGQRLRSIVATGHGQKTVVEHFEHGDRSKHEGHDGKDDEEHRNQ